MPNAIEEEYVNVRKHDEQVAKNYYNMFIDIPGISSDAIEADWKEKTLQFVDHGRIKNKLATIVLVSGENVIGSAVCQHWNSESMHPILLKTFQNYTGYVWGVYSQHTTIF